VIQETSSGPIFNPRLELKNNVYKRIGSVPGASVVFPVFSRIREDKKVNPQDVRFAQVREIIYIPVEGSGGEIKEPAKSLLIKREVFKKTLGTKLMVQKFFVWKTNKEDAGYPPYVFFYTNFSSERTEPLQSEIRVSGKEEQVMQFMQDYMDKNIKKGWEKV
jgi:hypothetical protein